MASRSRYHKYILILIAANFLLKLIPASFLELANDEVYYYLYALYPDWSHFDHPPMIGWMIQAFTLNLRLDSELFIRLGAICLSSLNLYLIFIIGKRFFCEKTGWYAACLMASSVFFNLMAGLMILPDTPQITFWLASIYFAGLSLQNEKYGKKTGWFMILAGTFAGLAFLSKYHAAFLMLAYVGYILFMDRGLLRKPSSYLAALIFMIIISPVIFWNIQHDFISFRFHEERVALFENGIDLVSLSRFMAGQIAYFNPIVFVIILISFFRIKNIKRKAPEFVSMLLWTALPMFFLFSFFAFFKTTLPHWTGPAYIAFSLIAAEWLSTISMKKAKRILSMAMGLFLLVVGLGTAIIKTGYFMPEPDFESNRMGKNDFTLDMYGWDKISEKVDNYFKSENIPQEKVCLISDKWFPAAHIDYYLCRAKPYAFFVAGPIQDIHKYYWINGKRGGFPKNKEYYYLTSSRYFKDPGREGGMPFENIELEHQFEIERMTVPVEKVYLFRMTNPDCRKMEAYVFDAASSMDMRK